MEIRTTGAPGYRAVRVAARILSGVVEDRFLILTHPEMQQLIVRKAEDPDRWIRGMQRLWARTSERRGD